MTRIGSVMPANEIDWDRVEEHGSFLVFSHGQGDGEFQLRCVVWRDSKTREIVGHNFDYARAASRDWWTAHESGSALECLRAVPPEWRERGEVVVKAFLEADYPALLSGNLPLPEIFEDAVQQVGLLANLLGRGTPPRL